MARLSDGGIGSIIRVFPAKRATEDSPWSAASYPYPDPDLAPDPFREMVLTVERLFWRSTGALAYGAGKAYPSDERAQLCTWAELTAPKVAESETPQATKRRKGTRT